MQPPSSQNPNREVLHEGHESTAAISHEAQHRDASSEPKTCLFDLPLEIQDLIFNHAYPAVDILKAITRLDGRLRRSRIERLAEKDILLVHSLGRKCLSSLFARSSFRLLLRLLLAIK
jgi:hypothetical protein